MKLKDSKKADLFERWGYLDYIVDEIGCLADEGEKEGLKVEVGEIVKDIISQSIELYKDYPNIVDELKSC